MQVDRYIYNLSHRVFPVKTLLESGTEPVSGLLGFQAPTLTSRFIRGCVSPLRRCTLVTPSDPPRSRLNHGKARLPVMAAVASSRSKRLEPGKSARGAVVSTVTRLMKSMSLFDCLHFLS